MENLYKYDLSNRFPDHHFNITQRDSVFDIEVLDQDEKLLGRKTSCGNKKTCFLYARGLMGIDPHIAPILKPRERDKLENCPTGLEILLQDRNVSPFHKKQRRWGNDWLDV